MATCEVTVRRKVVKRNAPRPPAMAPTSRPRIPRISRLMAFAIVADEMIRKGEVRDYAELARMGQVSRARMTQIMGLLTLAPQIQEALLNLPATAGPEAIAERSLRPIAATADWNEQTRLWQDLNPPRT